MSPDPTTVHPLPAHDRLVFLKPLVTSPNIDVGEYTYYDDPDGATDFERHNVLYAYGPERLVTAMPGVRIGDGPIIAADAVVTADVDVERLRRAAWWDWPADLVTEHARTPMAGTPADIARVATEHGRGRPL